MSRTDHSAAARGLWDAVHETAAAIAALGIDNDKETNE